MRPPAPRRHGLLVAANIGGGRGGAGVLPTLDVFAASPARTSIDGIEAMMTVEGGTTAKAFLEFIDKHLA